jgi:hypothetical protein
VTEVPPQILEIAERLRRNERLKRRSIQTLLKWFGAARRGTVVVSEIRAALLSTGLETDPDFAQGTVNDYITFHLSGEAIKAASPSAGLESRNTDHTVSTPGAMAVVQTNT